MYFTTAWSAEFSLDKYRSTKHLADCLSSNHQQSSSALLLYSVPALPSAFPPLPWATHSSTSLRIAPTVFLSSNHQVPAIRVQASLSPLGPPKVRKQLCTAPDKRRSPILRRGSRAEYPRSRRKWQLHAKNSCRSASVHRRREGGAFDKWRTERSEEGWRLSVADWALRRRESSCRRPISSFIVDQMLGWGRIDGVMLSVVVLRMGHCGRGADAEQVNRT